MLKWTVFAVLVFAASACNLDLSGITCEGSLSISDCDCKCCDGSLCYDCSRSVKKPASDAMINQKISTISIPTRRPALPEFCGQVCQYTCGPSSAICISRCSYTEHNTQACVSYRVICDSGVVLDVICEAKPTSTTSAPTTTSSTHRAAVKTTSTKNPSIVNYCDNICQNVCGTGSCDSNCVHTYNGVKACVSYVVDCGWSPISSVKCSDDGLFIPTSKTWTTPAPAIAKTPSLTNAKKPTSVPSQAAAAFMFNSGGALKANGIFLSLFSLALSAGLVIFT